MHGEWLLAEQGTAHGIIRSGMTGAQSPAGEFARHLADLCGVAVPVVPITDASAQSAPAQIQIIIGDSASLAGTRWADAVTELSGRGEEAYLVKTLESNGLRALLLVGQNRLATFYAVYDLLGTLGLDFFFDHVRTPRLTRLVIPHLHKLEAPCVAMRIFKPQILGDYSPLHSFWFWDQSRWEQALRWCVQNRLNTLHLMFFAGMNWNSYSAHPEARVQNDPILDTDARMRMAQALIQYAHAFGLKVWIAFVTNGATYEYARAHPEQACTGLGGVYEGDLCGRAGRSFLEDTAREYFETYAEADGVVFWPPEGHCLCPDCVSGRAFVDLVTGHIRQLRTRWPDKAIMLLDWSLPADSGALPEDLTILNMHEFSQLPPYLRKGHTTIFDLIVNWDTASCTTTSPRVHDMHREMSITHAMGVKGFEAHLVSAFSGELNIQAFAAIAWNPAAFNPDAFTENFLARYYGAATQPLRTAIAHLEAVWTPPFNAYTSLIVSRFHHWMVPGDLDANCVCEGTDYVADPSAPGPGLVKQHRRLPRAEMLERFDQALAHLQSAHTQLGSLSPANAELRFLSCSAEAQWRYVAWCSGRYRTCIALADATQAARAGNWTEAEAHARRSERLLADARASLLSLKALVDCHPQWFQTRRCVAARDLETWIGSQALNDEVNDDYASSVIGGRTIPTAGLPRMASLLAGVQRDVRAHIVPNLIPPAEELMPHVKYPLQRDRIIAAIRQRLAKAHAG